MALTLTASEAGLEIVDDARKKKGWNKSATLFLEAAGNISRSTLDKFWARKPITHENFVGICTAVKVDWQTVVEQDDRDIDNSRQPAANKLDDFKGLKIAKQIHDWLTAGLSCVTWLHSYARVHGREFLQDGLGWYPGHDHELSGAIPQRDGSDGSRLALSATARHDR